VGDELVKVGIVAEDKTGPGVSSAKRNLDSLGKGAQSAATGFNTLKAAAAGVGGAIAVLGTAKAIQGITGMAAGALQSYAAYERLGQSINALTAKQALLNGSATNMTQALAQTKTQSKELLAWIEKLAIASPFRQDDVAQAFRLSMALGFNTKEAQRLTQAMLNFATATGQGGDTVERINRALGQMKTKGKVSLEEINQLTEAGVDAMRILRDATGKTGEALYKDISKGVISADFAIEAIIADTEKLYAGAGDAAATSMSGLLSSLQEVQEIVGRELFTGVFEQLQGPLAALTTIVTAPEFKAGLEQWSATLGTFTGEQIEAAAGAMERIDAAISPLLNAGAPAWLTALQGAALLSGTEFKVKITPEMTALEQPEGGWKIKVTPYATSIEAPEGGWKVDVSATAISLSTKEGETIAVDAVAKTLTIDPGFALPALTFQAKIDPESQKIIDALMGAGAEGGAKGLGYELGQQTRAEIDKQVASIAEALNINFGITFGGYATLDEIVKEQQIGIKTVETTASWKEGTQQTLFDQMQQQFKEPIMLAGSWLATVLTDLWNQVQAQFDANPIDVLAKVKLELPKIQGPVASPSREQARWNIGEGYGMTTPPQYRGWGDAIGDGFFAGGLALVGEQGPELAVLPRGTAIYNNRDTQRLYGGAVPRFATGTTQLPPGTGPIIGLLRGLGLWVPQSSAQIGPKTQAEALGWKDFTQQGTQAMQTAADRTGAAFEETAAKVNKTFESALSSVPGLFGSSQVTAQDMELSKYGAYQEKADEWLRQLEDEVKNGKDWAGVDIKDAAERAGIDPNLPKDIIFELVKQAWNDSSLFADAKNLDLINQDAVKAAIEQQQKEMQGQANIKALFGITDENLQQQSEALGQGLAAVFGGASDTDAVKGAGTALFTGVMGGFTDPATAAAGVKGMADSIVSATGTPENQSALYDAGEAGYAAYYNGWKAAANTAPITPPGGSSGSETPPGKAVGVGFWQGGWMTVHAAETVYAPRGTTVRNARESGRGGGVTVVNNVTINRQIDEAAFMARMLRQVRRAS